MRRYMSVLMLASRSTLYKILGLLLVMAGAQAALFCGLLQKSAAGERYLLEELVDESGIPLVCGAAFLVLCALLCLTGCEFGSKTGYTLRRLSVREETVAFLWAGYNTACFAVFLAVQVGVLWLLGRVYTLVMAPAYWNEQTIFLAFYRNRLMHSLLPLEEISRWARNGALLIALGVVTAGFSYKQRRGQKGVGAVALALLTVAFFQGEPGQLGADMMIVVVALSVAAVSLYNMRGRCYET